MLRRGLLLDCPVSTSFFRLLRLLPSSSNHKWFLRISIVPLADLVDGNKALWTITFSKATGGFVCLLTFINLFLESVSAYFTLTNLPLANALLTTAYISWTVVYTSVGTAAILSTRPLLGIISNTLQVNKEHNLRREDKNITDLEKCHSQLKSGMLMASQQVFGSAIVVFLMAIIRYDIWTSQGWSLFFLFTFVYIIGLSSVVYFSYMLAVDIKLMLSPPAKKSVSRDKSLSSAEDLRMKSIGESEKTSDQVLDSFIEEKAAAAAKTA